MFCFKIYAFFLFWFKHTRSVCTLYDYNKQYSLVVFGYSCISFPKSNKGLVGKLQSNLAKLVKTTSRRARNSEAAYDTSDQKKTSTNIDDSQPDKEKFARRNFANNTGPTSFSLFSNPEEEFSATKQQ